MDGTETFLAIVVIGIDHDERCAKNILCCKHGLTGSPRFCTAFRQSARDVVTILERVVYRYLMIGADRGDAITDHLFELLLDILADNKNYMVETGLDCIMD